MAAPKRRTSKAPKGVEDPPPAAAPSPDETGEDGELRLEQDDDVQALAGQVAILPAGGDAAALLPIVELDEGGTGEDLATLIERPVVEERHGDSLVRHDPLSAYVNEIRRYPLLSREEEHTLAAQFYESGDPELAHRLVTSNLRLVVKIAHEYRRAYRTLLDLVQEGNVGLMQAVRKYDPFRGVKLSSYAAYWIRAYILKFILANWRLVKIGTTQAQRKLFFNLRKEKERLERLGFEPEHRLLAENLDVSERDVAEMERRLESHEMSLDAPVSRDDESGRTRGDSLPDASGRRPDVAAETDEMRALLHDKLTHFSDDLKGREKIIFQERWLTETPLTLQELGDRFGISRERARQIEKRLLDRLRTFLEAELGSAVDIGAVGPEE